MTTPGGGREGLAALPPTAAGDVGNSDLWGAERDSTTNWGVTYDQPLPSVEGNGDQIQT